VLVLVLVAVVAVVLMAISRESCRTTRQINNICTFVHTHICTYAHTHTHALAKLNPPPE
jgi:hypothetical protein